MDTTLVTPNFMPLYKQIRGLITESLIAGEWRPGDMIPSEMELASKFNVSQGTVRKAVDELTSQSILTRRQGKGTFVTAILEDDIKIRFLNLSADSGEKESTQHRLLKCNLSKANEDIAHKLQIKVGAIVIDVRRLLTFAGKPLIYEHIVVAASEFKGLNAAKVEAYKGSFYRMYETEYNIRMVRADEKIKAALPNDEIANALEVTTGTPMLNVERIAYTYGDKPMELRSGFYLTHDHHYSNQLE